MFDKKQVQQTMTRQANWKQGLHWSPLFLLRCTVRCRGVVKIKTRLWLCNHDIVHLLHLLHLLHLTMWNPSRLLHDRCPVAIPHLWLYLGLYLKGDGLHCQSCAAIKVIVVLVYGTLLVVVVAPIVVIAMMVLQALHLLHALVTTVVHVHCLHAHLGV